MSGVLRHIGLRRQMTVTVPVTLEQARENLGRALQDDIILKGQWQLTRRYWGHLSQYHLTLHGPRANRQFCFLTQGHLKVGDRPQETILKVEMVLGRASEVQLLCVIAVLPLLMGGMLRLFGLMVLPLFLAFLYGMTQWHFSSYSTEIRQLLHDRMMGHSGGRASLHDGWLMDG